MAGDEVRYGIIGTGMMGLEHAWNLSAIDGTRITAIADPHIESRRLLRQFAQLGDDVAEFADHKAL
ncbi:MAG: gfo/Idh/MocA family oxidoreductase, partial [Acidimicrobiales bacterium]